MKRNVIIDRINKFYLNLCDKNEEEQVFELLKNPRLDKLLSRIMKKQWDIIDENDLNKDSDLNKPK